jgi:hypothetical protein
MEINGSPNKTMIKISEGRIKEICKLISLRETLSGYLDKRKHKIIRVNAALGFTRSEDNSNYLSPRQMKAKYYNYNSMVNRKYNKHFKLLLESQTDLKSKYRFDNRGLMHYQQDDGADKELTNSKLCKVVLNEMTVKWVHLLKRNESSVPVEEINELQNDIKNCYVAIAACWVTNMMEHRDLFSEKDVKEWDDRVKVIVALSVYMCVLDEVMHNKEGMCVYHFITQVHLNEE